MTRSQSLGEEEAGLPGLREEEGHRRKEPSFCTARQAGKEVRCRPELLDLAVDSATGRFLM